MHSMIPHGLFRHLPPIDNESPPTSQNAYWVGFFGEFRKAFLPGFRNQKVGTIDLVHGSKSGKLSLLTTF